MTAHLTPLQAEEIYLWYERVYSVVGAKQEILEVTGISRDTLYRIISGRHPHTAGWESLVGDGHSKPR